MRKSWCQFLVPLIVLKFFNGSYIPQYLLLELLITFWKFFLFRQYNFLTMVCFCRYLDFRSNHYLYHGFFNNVIVCYYNSHYKIRLNVTPKNVWTKSFFLTSVTQFRPFVQKCLTHLSTLSYSFLRLRRSSNDRLVERLLFVEHITF